MFVVTTNFSNGEMPNGESVPRGHCHIWEKGKAYTGKQAEVLLEEGLISKVAPEKPQKSEKAKA